MWGFLPLTTLLLCSIFTATNSEEKQDSGKGAIVRARLEVKAFIRELLPYYHDVKIRYIPGKDPTMVFLNADNKVVLEEDVAEKKREEITQLLETHGLLKSAEGRSEVPEEPLEEEPEEPDEPWDEEEDREEDGFEDGFEDGPEGPETEEQDGDDATEHTEL